MNIALMHIALDLYVNKVASYVLDDFLPQEKDFYLNQAIQEYIKAQHTLLKSEERSQQAEYVHENLRSLIKTESIALATFAPISGTWQAQLPVDYLYYVHSSIRFPEVEKNGRLMTFPELKRYAQTKTNRPIYREIPVALHENLIVVMPDYTDPAPTEISLTWLRVPATVDFTAPTDCDLPEHTHHQLVRLAADKLLEDIKQLRPHDAARNAG